MSPFLLLESWGLLLLGPVGRALGIPGAFLLHNTGCGIYGRGVGHGKERKRWVMPAVWEPPILLGEGMGTGGKIVYISVLVFGPG
jgi:hypothetical protein